MKPPRVLVATAEGDDALGAPTPAARHHTDLVERLASGTEVRPIVLAWNPSMIADELGHRVEIVGPPVLARSSAVRCLRAARLTGAAARVKDLLLRYWLRLHRRLPVVLDGAACSTILPWLERHRAPVIWMLVNGEADRLEPLSAGDAAVVDHVLVETTEDRQAVRAKGLADAAVAVIARQSPVLVEPPPTGADPHIGVIGPLDDRHGVDLVARLLWRLRQTRERPVTVVWSAPGPPDLPPAVRHDLRNLGLTELLEVRGATDVSTFVGSVALVVLPWRVPVDRSLIDAVADAGRPCLHFAAHPAADADAEAGAVPFPLIEELADAASAWLDDHEGRIRLAANRGAERGTRRLIELLGDTTVSPTASPE